MLLAKPTIDRRLSREIVKSFGTKRIVSLLYYGTRAFELNTSGKSDYDFVLILDKYHETDTFILRRIVKKKMFDGIRFDLSLLYQSDLKKIGKSNFQVRALSLTYYKYLENAKVLLGENIFRKSPIRLDKHKQKKLMGYRIQEFYGRCDMLYVKSFANAELYVQLKKYVKDILWFLLCGVGVIELKDLTLIPFEDILCLAKKNRILNSTGYLDFLGLLKKDYSLSSLRKLENLRRKIYEKYLSLYYSR